MNKLTSKKQTYRKISKKKKLLNVRKSIRKRIKKGGAGFFSNLVSTTANSALKTANNALNTARTAAAATEETALKFTERAQTEVLSAAKSLTVSSPDQLFDTLLSRFLDNLESLGDKSNILKKLVGYLSYLDVNSIEDIFTQLEEAAQQQKITQQQEIAKSILFSESTLNILKSIGYSLESPEGSHGGPQAEFFFNRFSIHNSYNSQELIKQISPISGMDFKNEELYSKALNYSLKSYNFKIEKEKIQAYLIEEKIPNWCKYTTEGVPMIGFNFGSGQIKKSELNSFDYPKFIKARKNEKDDSVPLFYLFKENEQLIITIKGTTNLEDLKINLKLKPWILENNYFSEEIKNCYFHGGFLKRALAIFNLIFENYLDLNNTTIEHLSQILVCGHSLGGAVASILGLLINDYLNISKKVSGSYKIDVVCFNPGTYIYQNENYNIYRRKIISSKTIKIKSFCYQGDLISVCSMKNILLTLKLLSFRKSELAANIIALKRDLNPSDEEYLQRKGFKRNDVQEVLEILKSTQESMSDEPLDYILAKSFQIYSKLLNGVNEHTTMLFKLEDSDIITLMKTDHGVIQQNDIIDMPIILNSKSIELHKLKKFIPIFSSSGTQSDEQSGEKGLLHQLDSDENSVERNILQELGNGTTKSDVKQTILGENNKLAPTGAELSNYLETFQNSAGKTINSLRRNISEGYSNLKIIPRLLIDIYLSFKNNQESTSLPNSEKIYNSITTFFKSVKGYLEKMRYGKRKLLELTTFPIDDSLMDINTIDINRELFSLREFAKKMDIVSQIKINFINRDTRNFKIIVDYLGKLTQQSFDFQKIVRDFRDSFFNSTNGNQEDIENNKKISSLFGIQSDGGSKKKKKNIRK